MTNIKKIAWITVLVMVLGMAVSANAIEGAKPVQPQGKSAAAGLVNINTADAVQLDKLPRVGMKMAQRIVEYRKANGSFKKTQDLMKVKGIGPKVFEKLQNLITV